jgi:hypothetical protein
MFDDDEPEAIEPEDYPTLVAVARFARALPRISWFAAVGEPLSPAEHDDATAYLSALGFPDATVATIDDWEDAEAAARNPDWNTAWWEAEEQLRAGLIADALELIEEAELMAALNHVTASASESANGAAALAATRAGVADEELMRAAAGAAIQVAYQAALVLAAGAEEDHAFALKFRLFEAGRWPLGIVGATFNLF